MTALHRAVQCLQMDAVYALLELGADPSHKDGLGTTPYVLLQLNAVESAAFQRLPPEEREARRERRRAIEQLLRPGAPDQTADDLIADVMSPPPEPP
eukprot:5283540-Prymnesium_polylepis.1